MVDSDHFRAVKPPHPFIRHHHNAAIRYYPLRPGIRNLSKNIQFFCKGRESWILRRCTAIDRAAAPKIPSPGSRQNAREQN